MEELVKLLSKVFVSNDPDDYTIMYEGIFNNTVVFITFITPCSERLHLLS